MTEITYSRELYLVAHKVRGEPAFDIACKVQIGEVEGWIIPTSGHRAYPYWHERLAALLQLYPEEWEKHLIGKPMPPDLRDHYEVTASAPQAAKGKIVELDLAELGL